MNLNRKPSWLTKKLVNQLKHSIVDEILEQMNHEDGYRTIISWYDQEEEVLLSEVLVVYHDSEYLPSIWRAGIDGPSLPLSRKKSDEPGHYSHMEFALEEALRTIRNMFDDEWSNFITWAFHNEFPPGKTIAVNIEQREYKSVV